MTARREIAVTGLGVVSPFGRGIDALLAGLLAERSAITPLTLFPTTLDAPPFVGQVDSPLEDRGSSPNWWSRTDRLAVTAAREAWASAGLTLSDRDRCAVVLATTVGGLSDIEPEAACDPADYYRRRGLGPAAAFPVSHAGDVVASALGLGGPSLGVSVACASGAVAIADAARRIHRGETDLAMAGGSDALCAFTLAGFQSLQSLDPDPCRPFDRSRRGLNLGEGAGMLVLEDLKRARARGAKVSAVLRGWAFTNDAFHPTAPDEQGRGVAASLARAMQVADVDADGVGYVNAHGTGTPLNDVAEMRGYDAAFHSRSLPMPVSSTKSYIGHTLGAAGAIEAVITILALRSQRLFPTLRLTDPIESRFIDWMTSGGRDSAMNVAISVSAGFGGSNAALVFEVGTGAAR
jgi:3-oxoacyl-[acyl-carrier-protein] synthase II